MQKTEYKTTYLSMPYRQNESGFWIFKGKDMPIEPDIDAFFATPNAVEHLNEVATLGFDLIAIVPVLRGVVSQTRNQGQQPQGFAYPLTAGFALFWKRVV